MPYCSTCSNYFEGRGTYCAQHKAYYHNYSNYTDISGDPSSIKYRTNQYIPTTSRHRKHRQLGFHDSYDTLPDYDNHNAVVRYSSSNPVAYTGSLTDPITQPAALRPLTQTFTHLASSHAIASLTYSISPTGARSITATANPDREQCSICLTFFPDRHRLDTHLWEYPVGCDFHRVCLREEDVEWHATGERHERCFMRGCMSVYRREGGWKRGVVEAHVREAHSYV